MSKNRWGTFCTPEEDAQSQKKNAPLHCLTREESIGLAVCTFIQFIGAHNETATVRRRSRCHITNCFSRRFRTYTCESLIQPIHPFFGKVSNVDFSSQRNVIRERKRSSKRRLIKVPADLFLACRSSPAHSIRTHAKTSSRCCLGNLAFPLRWPLTSTQYVKERFTQARYVEHNVRLVRSFRVE